VVAVALSEPSETRLAHLVAQGVDDPIRRELWAVFKRFRLLLIHRRSSFSDARSNPQRDRRFPRCAPPNRERQPRRRHSN
jgi:hypothetical protein